MQTLDQVNQDIDNTLKDAPVRNITPLGMRTLLKKLTQYVTDLTLNKVSPWLNLAGGGPSLSATDAIYRLVKVIIGRNADDGSGAMLQATTANIPNLNGGISLNRAFAIGPNGAGGYRYFKIATLVASSAGSRDIMHVRAILGYFGSAGRTTVEATFGNRDAFTYRYKLEGDNTNCGIAAFRLGTGEVVLYAKIVNDFRTGVVNVLANTQGTIYDSLIEEVPNGALVFDSLDTATYTPTSQQDTTTFAVAGYVRTGTGNQPFKVTGVKAASNLSLKTGRYLELLLGDGTVVKVAEVN